MGYHPLDVIAADIPPPILMISVPKYEDEESFENDCFNSKMMVVCCTLEQSSISQIKKMPPVLLNEQTKEFLAKSCWSSKLSKLKRHKDVFGRRAASRRQPRSALRGK
jgi:hypothetical protein